MCYWNGLWVEGVGISWLVGTYATWRQCLLTCTGRGEPRCPHQGIFGHSTCGAFGKADQCVMLVSLMNMVAHGLRTPYAPHLLLGRGGDLCARICALRVLIRKQNNTKTCAEKYVQGTSATRAWRTHPALLSHCSFMYIVCTLWASMVACVCQWLRGLCQGSRRLFVYIKTKTALHET